MTQPVSDDLDTKKLPKDPNAAMVEMMYIIDSLRGIMVKESEALESADAARFLDLQEEKIITARFYQSGIEQLLARKDQLRSADPGLRNRLEAMQHNFHQVAQRNLQGLERMRSGTNRLHERIMMAARDSAMKENRFAYGSGGTLQQGNKVSIGLSEQA